MARDEADLGSNPAPARGTSTNSTTVRVLVAGSGTLLYQWQMDGVSIPGATGPYYELKNGVTLQSGRFRCIVSNSAGADTSNEETIGSQALLHPSAMNVKGDSPLPTEYSLLQNYPNPFNPTTTFKYSIPKAGHVRLHLFNLLGEVVATLEDQFRPAGYYELTFNATNLASGVYLYRLHVGDFVATRKLALLR
jgi:hypothetical protein